MPFLCDSSSSSNVECVSGLGNSLNFPAMKVTHLPTNKQVILPETLDNREESKLLAFKAEVMQITSNYISSHCDSRGNQKMNITADQLRGVNSLKKRCKQEDLVIMETEKSKRLSIMTKPNYIASTEPHIRDDLKVSGTGLVSIERLLNGHTL